MNQSFKPFFSASFIKIRQLIISIKSTYKVKVIQFIDLMPFLLAISVSDKRVTHPL